MANLINELLGSVQNQPKQDNSLPTSMSDSRMAEAISYVNTHGGDPKVAFMQLCQERGITPQAVMNELKARMGMR